MKNTFSAESRGKKGLSSNKKGANGKRYYCIEVPLGTIIYNDSFNAKNCRS